jgi:hypothetical protein
MKTMNRLNLCAAVLLAVIGSNVWVAQSPTPICTSSLNIVASNEILSLLEEEGVQLIHVNFYHKFPIKADHTFTAELIGGKVTSTTIAAIPTTLYEVYQAYMTDTMKAYKAVYAIIYKRLSATFMTFKKWIARVSEHFFNMFDAFMFGVFNMIHASQPFLIQLPKACVIFITCGMLSFGPDMFLEHVRRERALRGKEMREQAMLREQAKQRAQDRAAFLQMEADASRREQAMRAKFVKNRERAMAKAVQRLCKSDPNRSEDEIKHIVENYYKQNLPAIDMTIPLFEDVHNCPLPVDLDMSADKTIPLFANVHKCPLQVDLNMSDDDITKCIEDLCSDRLQDDLDIPDDDLVQQVIKVLQELLDSRRRGRTFPAASEDTVTEKPDPEGRLLPNPAEDAWAE